MGGTLAVTILICIEAGKKVAGLPHWSLDSAGGGVMGSIWGRHMGKTGLLEDLAVGTWVMEWQGCGCGVAREGTDRDKCRWDPQTGRTGRKGGWEGGSQAALPTAETRSGSVFLGLVNCYHFRRIFTSFGSCLSEIHNMCSLH